MSTKFSLEAILTATDKLTGPMKTAQRNAKTFSSRMQRSFGGVNKSIAKMNTGINRFAKRGIQMGLVAAGAAVGIATKQFIEFDQAITSAGAKFKDLDVTSADYQATLDRLGRTARDVAKVTEFTATDTAGALEKMAMAGMTSELSMALLAGTTDLATAAGTDLTTAVDIATDSLGAFGLATDDVAQAEINLNRISDVMAKTTTSSNTSLLELFESVKAGAAAFTTAGQRMETFNTLTGIMANAGIKGSMAGTSLRNVMLRLAKPTGEAAAVLEELGVRTQDEIGNFRDIVDILADFETGLEGMGSAQRTAALSTIFGARTVTGINTVLAAGVSNIRDYRTELDNAGGAANTMAEAMRASVGNRIKVLKSGLIELGLQFVEAFEIQGRNALDVLIEKVQTFDIQPVINAVVKFIEIAGKVFKILKDIGPEILIVVGAIKVWSAAQKILNIALTANPIGLWVTAIGTVLLLIERLIRKWRKFREETEGTGTLREFMFGKKQTTYEDDPETRGATRGFGNEFANPETQLQQQRITEEKNQRMELFLNAPKGYSFLTPEGVAALSVQLGTE